MASKKARVIGGGKFISNRDIITRYAPNEGIIQTSKRALAKALKKKKRRN